MKKILIAVFSMTFTGLSLSAQLQSSINNIKQQYSLMGISVVTVCNGDIGEICHAGLKDFTRSLPVDDSTMYRIASISKLVTAAGIMKLYEQGLFQLNDDVSDYLGYTFRNPNYPQTPVTFAMLLSHTSGIQDGSGYSSFLGATYNNSSPPGIASLFISGGSYYTADMWMNRNPGTYFTYSNANYGVVATLIENISGQRFDVYMKSQILDPLGIAGSYNVADITNINNVAVLYRKSGGSWSAQADNFQGVPPTPTNLSSYTPGTNGFIFGPQGGLRISPSDLARIMQMLINNGEFNGTVILNPATVALMTSPQWTYNGSNGDNYYGLFRSWGLGIQITTQTSGGDIVYPSVTMYGHCGEAYGLISDFYYDPVKRNGLVFMTNGAYIGYSIGTSSAFYSVEESVFSACYQHSYLPCVASGYNSSQTGDISVFPNPASNFIHIKMPELPDVIKKTELYDVHGKQVYCNSNTNPAQTIYLNGLNDGIYYLKITTSHRSFFKTVVVIRTESQD
jgi:CubicO group peptidase (beta-lactamase class C family)